MTLFRLIPIFALAQLCVGQALTGKELLEKSIAFHDPNDQWKTFKEEFKVTMETPDSPNRESTIFMDLPKEVFTINVQQDKDRYGYAILKDSCTITFDGDAKISEENIKKYRLSKERGVMYRDYYTYLYGLPMKLKDSGTKIAPKVERKTFKGKEYLVLNATYDVNVGKDIWYFYFDPKTYAMEVYQFFHDESKNDGEYILLNGLEKINGIQMPKTRAWYYNKDDKYLGTDILTPSK